MSGVYEVHRSVFFSILPEMLIVRCKIQVDNSLYAFALFFFSKKNIEDLSIRGSYSCRLDSYCIQRINRSLGSSPSPHNLKLPTEILIFLQLWFRAWKASLLLLPHISG